LIQRIISPYKIYVASDFHFLKKQKKGKDFLEKAKKKEFPCKKGDVRWIKTGWVKINNK